MKNYYAITRSKKDKFQIRKCSALYRTPAGGYGIKYESESLIQSGFETEEEARNRAAELKLNVIWPRQ